MARKNLDHFETYEWTGLFWFPDNTEQQFAGKIQYSPEKGIQLELISTDFSSEDDLDRKLLHGTISGEMAGPVTFFNVSLSLGGLHFGQSSMRTLRGNAEFLLHGFQIDDLHFDSIQVEYEKQFENIFFSPMRREQEILAFAEKAPISPEQGTRISLTMDTYGTWVSPSDVDTLFFSQNPDKFQEFKQSFSRLIEEPDLKLFRRTSLNPVFKIEKPESSLQTLFSIEYKWRQFWELLLDRDLMPINIWLRVSYQMKDDEKVYSELKPLLKNHFKALRKPDERFTFILPHLPINITSFEGQGQDLSVVNPALTKWFSMKNDPKWTPVTFGVARILNNKRKLADTFHYVSLISEIKKLLGLLEKAPDTVATLVDTYATEDWKQELSSHLKTLNGDTIGKFLSDIRNAISHPNSTTDYSRHLAVIQDNNLFQKVYAYLAGLFLQVVIQELGSIPSSNIDEHIKAFIAYRGSWHTPEYS